MNQRASQMLEIGYGRVNVTPDYPVRLAGSAAVRLASSALDPIYMTCVAIRQGKETFLLVTMDFVGSYKEFTNAVRTTMSQATGVPEDHVLLNSTHTHSSVFARDDTLEGIVQYRKDLNLWAADVGREAVADLAPVAEVRYGSTRHSGMVWVRHYKMADGTFAGANYGSFQSGIVGHASEADQELQMIRFVRAAADKKDVVLMNFPAHATLNGSSIYLSADFPGPAREYVARNTDTLVAYFIAAAGDQVPSSRIEGEQFSADYRVYGEEVGRIAVSCMDGLKRLDATELGFARRTFQGKSNKEGLDRLDEAKSVEAIWNRVGGRGTPEGRQAAKAHGFSSVYAVTAILNRAAFDENRSMELNALSFGNVSLIFAPYEMFGTNGAQIKKDSPYEMTFLVSCAHAQDGYLPSEFGWKLGCYEAQITKFARGTAERLVAEFVDMLKEMKNRPSV